MSAGAVDTPPPNLRHAYYDTDNQADSYDANADFVYSYRSKRSALANLARALR